jgi:hypothetical protein
MQDLLHVEEKIEKKFNKINTKSFKEIGGRLLVLLENLNELGLVEVVLYCLELRFEGLNMNSFCHWKFSIK